MGAAGSWLYLVARDQRSLVEVATAGKTRSDPLGLDGTVAGRTYRLSEVTATGDGERLWFPLVDGTERLGVLEVLLGLNRDVDIGPAWRDEFLVLAGLVAELVVSKGQYTDIFERARRALPMGVSAEMLWRQLPPLTFATDRFVLTAQLEPWHEVGGDAFDYSIDGELLRLAVFDGMGHGLSATLLTSVALAAYRNARRAGLDLIATAGAIDLALSAPFGDESFVTGVLAELDVDRGVCAPCARRTPRRCWCGRAGRSASSSPTRAFRWGSAAARTASSRRCWSRVTGSCCSATESWRPGPRPVSSSAPNGSSTCWCARSPTSKRRRRPCAA